MEESANSTPKCNVRLCSPKQCFKHCFGSGLALDFTLHDIKAKGISDFAGTVGEKQKFFGHKMERQVATYVRKVAVVQTIGSNDENSRN